MTRLSLLLLLAACGRNEAVVAAEKMAAAVCACQDVHCALAAQRQGLEEAMKHKDSRGSHADALAIKAAGKRVQGCLSELRKR